MSYLLDLHVYTNNTPGARDKISYLCETAAEKNIRAVAFTDVLDAGRYSEFDLKRQVLHAFFDISKARQLFSESVTVYAGIELRQAFLHPETVKSVLASQRFDIVLTCVSGENETQSFELPPEIPPEAFASFSSRYCELLERTVNETDFDVLSRVLAPLRGTRCDYACFEEGMRPVLQVLAAKEKALEIDTRDLLGSERIRDLYLRLLAFFRACGGRYITFGSECFSHDELGTGVDIAKIAAKRAGFSQFAYYERRVPHLETL